MLDEAALQAAVSDALRRGSPVDREAAKMRRKPMEITVNRRWKGHMNPLVMLNARRMSSGTLSHVKFVPDKESGLVVMLPAVEGESGAEPINLSATRRVGWINLYGALLDFNLKFTGNRRLRLPFAMIEVPDNEGKKRLVGVLQVINPEPTAETTYKKKAQSTPAPAAPAPQPEAE